MVALKQKRVGLYQHYYGGNVDEGWTRWLLEQWGYNPTSILDPELKKGDLTQNSTSSLSPTTPPPHSPVKLLLAADAVAEVVAAKALGALPPTTLLSIAVASAKKVS